VKTRTATRPFWCDGCPADIKTGDQCAHATRVIDGVQVTLHFCRTCAPTPPTLTMEAITNARRERKRKLDARN